MTRQVPPVGGGGRGGVCEHSDRVGEECVNTVTGWGEECVNTVTGWGEECEHSGGGVGV